MIPKFRVCFYWREWSQCRERAEDAGEPGRGTRRGGWAQSTGGRTRNRKTQQTLSLGEDRDRVGDGAAMAQSPHSIAPQASGVGQN